MILSVLGAVVLFTVVVVGAYWLIKNVTFKQSEKKENSK